MGWQEDYYGKAYASPKSYAQGQKTKKRNQERKNNAYENATRQSAKEFAKANGIQYDEKFYNSYNKAVTNKYREQDYLKLNEKHQSNVTKQMNQKQYNFSGEEYQSYKKDYDKMRSALGYSKSTSNAALTKPEYDRLSADYENRIDTKTANFLKDIKNKANPPKKKKTDAQNWFKEQANKDNVHFGTLNENKIGKNFTNNQLFNLPSLIEEKLTGKLPDYMKDKKARETGEKSSSDMDKINMALGLTGLAKGGAKMLLKNIISKKGIGSAIGGGILGGTGSYLGTKYEEQKGHKLSTNDILKEVAKGTAIGTAFGKLLGSHGEVPKKAETTKQIGHKEQLLLDAPKTQEGQKALPYTPPQQKARKQVDFTVGGKYKGQKKPNLNVSAKEQLQRLLQETYPQKKYEVGPVTLKGLPMPDYRLPGGQQLRLPAPKQLKQVMKNLPKKSAPNFDAQLKELEQLHGMLKEEFASKNQDVIAERTRQLEQEMKDHLNQQEEYKFHEQQANEYDKVYKHIVGKNKVVDPFTKKVVRTLAKGAKINIPEQNYNDYAHLIPKQFLSPRGSHEGTPIDVIAHELGFDNMEEFAKHLSSLNNSKNIVKKGKGNFVTKTISGNVDNVVDDLFNATPDGQRLKADFNDVLARMQGQEPQKALPGPQQAPQEPKKLKSFTKAEPTDLLENKQPKKEQATSFTSGPLHGKHNAKNGFHVERFSFNGELPPGLAKELEDVGLKRVFANSTSEMNYSGPNTPDFKARVETIKRSIQQRLGREHGNSELKADHEPDHDVDEDILPPKKDFDPQKDYYNNDYYKVSKLKEVSVGDKIRAYVHDGKSAFFTEGKVTDIKKDGSVKLDAGMVGKFDVPAEKVWENLSQKEPKKMIKPSTPDPTHEEIASWREKPENELTQYQKNWIQSDNARQKLKDAPKKPIEKTVEQVKATNKKPTTGSTDSTKKYFSLSPNVSDVNAIKKAQPEQLLLAYDKWGKNKAYPNIRMLSQELGYEPKDIIIDSGAFAFSKKKPEIYDKIMQDFVENYGEFEPEEIAGLIRSEQQENAYKATEVHSNEFKKYIDYIDLQLRSESKMKNTTLHIMNFDNMHDPEQSVMLFDTLKHLYPHDNVVPVYHYGNDEAFLKHYVDGGADNIALGGSVKVPIKERIAWVKGLIKEYPNVQFHLLGTMSKKMMAEVPELHSFDGSGWVDKTKGVTKEEKVAKSVENVKKISKKAESTTHEFPAKVDVPTGKGSEGLKEIDAAMAKKGKKRELASKYDPPGERFKNSLVNKDAFYLKEKLTKEEFKQYVDEGKVLKNPKEIDAREKEWIRYADGGEKPRPMMTEQMNAEEELYNKHSIMNEKPSQAQKDDIIERKRKIVEKLPVEQHKPFLADLREVTDPKKKVTVLDKWEKKLSEVTVDDKQAKVPKNEDIDPKELTKERLRNRYESVTEYTRNVPQEYIDEFDKKYRAAKTPEDKKAILDDWDNNVEPKARAEYDRRLGEEQAKDDADWKRKQDSMRKLEGFFKLADDKNLTPEERAYIEKEIFDAEDESSATVEGGGGKKSPFSGSKKRPFRLTVNEDQLAHEQKADSYTGNIKQPNNDGPTVKKERSDFTKVLAKGQLKHEKGTVSDPSTGGKTRAKDAYNPTPKNQLSHEKGSIKTGDEKLVKPNPIKPKELDQMSYNVLTGEISAPSMENTKTRAKDAFSPNEDGQFAMKFNGGDIDVQKSIKEENELIKELSDNTKDLLPQQGNALTLPEIINKLPKKLSGYLHQVLEHGKAENVNMQIKEVKNFLKKIVTKKGGLGIRKGSKESKWVQQYGEQRFLKDYLTKTGKKASDFTADELRRLNTREMRKVAGNKAQSIIDAHEFFKKKYSEYIDQYNKVRQSLGLEPIHKRSSTEIYKHFQDLEDLDQVKNTVFGSAGNDVKTNFHDGNRENWVKGEQWTTKDGFKENFKNKIIKGKFLYKDDAVGGFISFLKSASHSIHLQPIIHELRNTTSFMENSIGKNKLPRLRKALDKHANDLAGHTNKGDLSFHDMFDSRRVTSTIHWANSRVQANMIKGNIGSLVGQLGGIPLNVARTGVVNSLRGGVRTAMEVGQFLGGKRKGFPYQQSKFMRERYVHQHYEPFNDRWYHTPGKVADWLLNTIDKVVGHFTWNGMYEKGKMLARKDSSLDPIQYADYHTREVLAGRGVGEVPLFHKSLVGKVLAPFTLEVGNQMKVLIRMGMDKKEVGNLITYAVAAYGINKLSNWLRGSEITYDPISAVADGYQDGEGSKIRKVMKSIGYLAGETIGSIPGGNSLVSIINDRKVPFTGGEYKYKDVFGDRNPNRFGTSVAFTKGMESPWYYALPFGGSQIDKVIKGNKLIKKKGVYNKSGNLRYPFDPGTGPKGIVKKSQVWAFGPGSAPESKQYYKDLPKTLSPAQTKRVDDKVTGEERVKQYQKELKERAERTKKKQGKNKLHF